METNYKPKGLAPIFSIQPMYWKAGPTLIEKLRPVVAGDFKPVTESAPASFDNPVFTYRFRAEVLDNVIEATNASGFIQGALSKIATGPDPVFEWSGPEKALTEMTQRLNRTIDKEISRHSAESTRFIVEAFSPKRDESRRWVIARTRDKDREPYDSFFEAKQRLKACRDAFRESLIDTLDEHLREHDVPEHIRDKIIYHWKQLREIYL